MLTGTGQNNQVIPNDLDDIYYRALSSRDSRFDGRFFTGVKTTGVYCRPICPAPTPKLENIRFYASSSGAEADGFRPCKRCRPDASPGTPAWSGTSATVSLALKLINDGFLDEHNVTELGDAVGVGERQLRRLFTEHLGAPPLAVALTRRLDFARKLIDETKLSMTDIAFASGFESIRRFNDAIRKRFQYSPSVLRENSKKQEAKTNGKNHTTLLLPFRPPLDWTSLLAYLKDKQTRGVEVLENNKYWRSIRLETIGSKGTNREITGFLSVTPARKKNHLELKLYLDDTTQLMTIVQRVRRIFDLEADPLSIMSHLGKDPALAPIIPEFPGLRITGGWDNGEIAIRTIIGQHVSIQAANTITARLVQRCGTPVLSSPVPGITHLFPTAKAIAEADLSNLGIPTKRAEAISTLAEKLASGEINLEQVTNPAELKKHLLALPGIGKWTVEYMSMRALKEPDAFPATDLGLKRELEDMKDLPLENYTEGKRPDTWQPWRAYAAMYLWKRYSRNVLNNAKAKKKGAKNAG